MEAEACPDCFSGSEEFARGKEDYSVDIQPHQQQRLTAAEQTVG